MIKKHHILIVLSLILAISCIEKINIEAGEFEKKLVIDGYISNESAPYRISLHQNAPFPENPDLFRSGPPIGSAIIMAFETPSGNSTEFKYLGDGIYESINPDFKGQEGMSYYIEIQYEGKVYTTIPTLMTSVPEIDSIYYTVSEGIEVFVDFEDRADKNDFLKWKWEGDEQILTSLPGPPDFPDTFDCCTECYMHKLGESIIIYDDAFTNGKMVKGKKIMDVPLNDGTDYLVNVSQISISEEEHDYLQLLKTNIGNKGGLFDPLPFNMEGNVFNADNKADKALGFFSVGAVLEKPIKVKRKEKIPNANIISQTDCRDIPGATEIKPENWNQ